MTIWNRALTMGFAGVSPRSNAPIAALVRVAAAVGIAIAIAATIRDAAAEEPFGDAIGVADLATLRGGDDTNSHNVINTSTSTQETTATNQNNSITAGGDVIAGAIQVDFGRLHRHARHEQRRHEHRAHGERAGHHVPQPRPPLGPDHARPLASAAGDLLGGHLARFRRRGR